MPITNKFEAEVKEKKVYPPLPKDVYPVELLDISSEQKPTYDTRNKSKEEQIMEIVLKFQFTVLKGKDGEENLRGRNVWDGFVSTYIYEGKKGKNKLFKIVEALVGHDLSQEEMAVCDSEFVNSLIGKHCRVMIEHNKKDDVIYDNIANYLPANSEETHLTKEEIESATITKKEEPTDTQRQAEHDATVDSQKNVKYPTEEINPEDIPF